MVTCLIDGCGAPPAPAAPLVMCDRHLAMAADWSMAAYGVEDALPVPCRVCGSRLGRRLPSAWLCAICEWRHGEVVDDELPAPRVDVVYYLRFSDRVKIGTTANPRQRLAALRHEELMAFERGDRSVEARRHEQFREERLERTEWFRLSATLGTHIERVRAGVGDPWALHARWTSEALALRG